MAAWFNRSRTEETVPVLNADYLERLAKHIGQVQTNELLSDGLLELTDRLDELRDQAKAGAHKRVGELAHDIAGAAGHLGLTAMSRAAVEVNRIARHEPPPSEMGFVADILDLRAESLEALARYIGQGTDETDAASG